MAHERGDRLAQRLHEELDAWHPRSADQLAFRAEYEAFLHDKCAAAVERDPGRAHVTGSAFVFTPDLEDVLLGFHEKAGSWIQLGGHVEMTDHSVRAAPHRDVGYGFLATGTPTTSDESEAVEWWAVDRLPNNVSDNFDARIRRAAHNARP